MNILTPSLLEKDLLPGVRLAKHGVLFYFLGAFGIAWLCLGLAILAGRGIIALPFSLFVTLGTLGPLLSAIAMTAHEAGGAGVRALLAQAVRWRVRPGWYAVIFVGTALLILTAFLLSLALGEPLPPAPSPSVWLSLPAVMAVLAIFGMCEEVGWRGFALPRLQSRYGTLAASLIVGVVHGVWHLPVWFIRGAGYDNLPFPVFVVFAVALSVVFAWLYNGTGGSVLIVSLAHAAINGYGSIWGAAAYSLPTAARGLNPVVYMTMVLVPAALLVAGLTKPYRSTPES